MDFSKLVRNGVRTANVLSKSLQTTVTLEQWQSEGYSGDESFGSPLTLRAIVDLTRRDLPAPGGQVTATRAVIYILEPVPPNGAPNRVEPIDPRDKFTLPDGSTGPIVEASGLIDAGTGRPYFHEVWLGNSPGF